MDNRNSVLGRLRLLKKVLQGASDIPRSFTTACKSQGEFAKFKYPPEGIEPMALNTLKSSAEKIIEGGGWAYLDEMRKSCLKTVKKLGNTKPSSKEKTAIQRQELEQQKLSLEIERRYRIRLQVAYEALLNHVRGLAKNDPEVAHFINRHITGFSLKRLSLKEPNGDSNDS